LKVIEIRWKVKLRIERSLKILLKLLNKLNQSPQLTGADLFDFFLRKVANGNEIFSNLTHVFDEVLLDRVFFIELGIFVFPGLFLPR
jgi:hypothetical protein